MLGWKQAYLNPSANLLEAMLETSCQPKWILTWKFLSNPCLGLYQAGRPSTAMVLTKTKFSQNILVWAASIKCLPALNHKQQHQDINVSTCPRCCCPTIVAGERSARLRPPDTIPSAYITHRMAQIGRPHQWWAQQKQPSTNRLLGEYCCC